MGKNKVEVVVEPGKPTLVARRSFNAPRALVFDAHAKPELLKQWWGPRRSELIVCEIDFRVGGTWRFVQRALDGKEHSFSGVFKEIVKPEKIVQTFVYDPFPSAAATQTLTFEEKDGVTTLTSEGVYASVESRDWHLQAGSDALKKARGAMELGMSESFERLDEILETAKSARK